MKARAKTVKGGKQKSRQKGQEQEEICTLPPNQQATSSRKCLLSLDVSSQPAAKKSKCDPENDVDYEDDDNDWKPSTLPLISLTPPFIALTPSGL